MGANYDILVCRAAHEKDLLESLSRFLLINRQTCVSAGRLDCCQVDDDRAILVSPPERGWIELAVLPITLKIGLAAWFCTNPLAAHLSRFFEPCFHFWSLDSGYVAGYAAYSNGRLVESKTAFSSHARNRENLMEAVPTPAQLSNCKLSDALRMEYDFTADAEENLEFRIATLVSRFGFRTQLVDFCDAVDDGTAVTVTNAKYGTVDLNAWRVIRINND